MGDGVEARGLQHVVSFDDVHEPHVMLVVTTEWSIHVVSLLLCGGDGAGVRGVLCNDYLHDDDDVGVDNLQVTILHLEQSKSVQDEIKLQTYDRI